MECNTHKNRTFLIITITTCIYKMQKKRSDISQFAFYSLKNVYVSHPDRRLFLFSHRYCMMVILLTIHNKLNNVISRWKLYLGFAYNNIHIYVVVVYILQVGTSQSHYMRTWLTLTSSPLGRVTCFHGTYLQHG